MRTFLVRTLTAVLTCTFGATGTLLRNYIASRSDHPSIIVSTQSKPNRTYERGPAGLATTGSFITLNSSDGMNFTKWSVYCGSPERAAKELAKRLKGAAIVTRETMFGDAGRRIGEKLVAKFPAGDRSGRSAILIWTENDELFEVDGSSVHDILEYRKDFQR